MARTATDGAVRSLCHDVRQHVSAVTVLAQLARGVPDLPADADGLLADIQREAAALRDLCRRLTARQRHVTAVRLDEVVRDAADHLRRRWPGRLHLESRSVVVPGDEVELLRVFDNLLRDASEAAGPDGSVEVAMLWSDGSVTVTVAGSGGRSFPPVVGDGAGMGLLVAEELTRANGGRTTIHVTDEGGRVCVALPALAGPAGEAPGTPARADEETT
ncbi:MAG TPA: ATP-binding protein [Nitriliruptorales bacterium]|nr:ATP-binding protein [Nitriliruptorales bacterium]